MHAELKLTAGQWWVLFWILAVDFLSSYNSLVEFEWFAGNMNLIFRFLLIFVRFDDGQFASWEDCNSYRVGIPF